MFKVKPECPTYNRTVHQLNKANLSDTTGGKLHSLLSPIKYESPMPITEVAGRGSGEQVHFTAS
jgi:hypothetical protein